MTRLLALGLLTAVLAGPALAAAQDEDAQDEIGRSAIPIVGYDDKSGWLYGAAGFLYSDKEPGINAGLFGVSNLDDFHSATLNYEQRSLGPWAYSVHLLGERGFDHFYGEGDLTSATSPLFIRLYHYEARPMISYRLAPHFRVGLFADFRARLEEGSHVFPDEASLEWGLNAQWDTRDKLINTRNGDFFQASVARMPWQLGFTQWNIDLRRFKRLRRELVWGNRLVAGASLGQPSYLFRYQLGGLDLLRGYKTNRFRGAEFFLIQQELRWLFTRWLSLNLSVDLGDIRDDAYHQLKATGQVGLRLGLPPDWGQKMRVDLGVAADQMTFQIQFGEIF